MARIKKINARYVQVKFSQKREKNLYSKVLTVITLLKNSMAGIRGTSEKTGGKKLLSGSEKMHMAAWGQE